MNRKVTSIQDYKRSDAVSKPGQNFRRLSHLMDQVNQLSFDDFLKCHFRFRFNYAIVTYLVLGIFDIPPLLYGLTDLPKSGGALY